MGTLVALWVLCLLWHSRRVPRAFGAIRWMRSTACGATARAMPAHPELLEPLHCAREALHALVLIEVQRAEDGGEA